MLRLGKHKKSVYISSKTDVNLPKIATIYTQITVNPLPPQLLINAPKVIDTKK